MPDFKYIYRRGIMAKKFNKKSDKRKSCKQCRLCGKSCRSYKNIFKSSVKILEENPVNKLTSFSYKPIPVVIQECLNFHITKENQVPNVICMKCIKELTSWLKFQIQCVQKQLSSGIEFDVSKTNYSVEISDKTNICGLSAENPVDSREIIVTENDTIFNCNTSQKKSEKKAFEKCLICKSIFKNLNEKSTHRSSDKGCIFTCSQCSKEFRSKDTLRNHMAIHSSTNNFCCHVCGLLFSTRSRLYHHFQSHEPTKRFQCNHCSKQFSITSDLQRHIRTHTGERRPFKCSECESQFTQYSLMVRHIEGVHKKTKRFTCSICSKSFLYKNHFSAHLMLHSGQKDMVCDICDKSFVTKNALFRHQRNHTGEKPYPCPECGKRFADCSNRKRHALQHHSSNIPNSTKNVALDRPKKKRRIQQCKSTEIIGRSKENKPLTTLRTFLEDPELLLGNLNEKRDDSTSQIEELAKNNVEPDVFNEFNENAHNSEIQTCENNTLTLTVLEDDDNRSLEFLSSHTLLQYDNILPRIEEENFLQIKNKLISNGMEQSENYTINNKLDEFNHIFNQTDVEKIRLNNSVQCHNLSSTDVLNLELALGTLGGEQVDIQQRWAADILNNIAPCETQSILKMLNNQGTILLTFPENEDFST